MLGQCAREAGELEPWEYCRWCDVLLVVMPLQALREEPLAPALRWPGDDKATCVRVEERRGDKGQRATANGASRVRDNAQMLCLCLHCDGSGKALDGPDNRLLPVLDAKGALPVSVLALYTTNYGSLSNDSQANRHTAWHTTLV